MPCQVFAKVESFNPGLSVKDRTALYIIEKAEKDGLLKKGGTIVETTSGNTGFSVAMIARIKVLRRGKVRRAKLNYLKKLKGKAARISEQR